MSKEFTAGNAVWPRLNVTSAFASSSAGCEAAGDIVGPVAFIYRSSFRKEQSETASHILPALTGKAARGGQGVCMSSTTQPSFPSLERRSQVRSCPSAKSFFGGTLGAMVGV